MAFISLQDITVRYSLKNRGTHTIFHNLNLEIEEGDFVSVIGETGCGKSTLLRLLLGSEKPLTGRVVVAGKQIDHPSRDRGYVPQKYSLFPDKTVLRNIAFGPVMESSSAFSIFWPSWWKKRSLIYKDAMQTMLRVGLSERDAQKYPDQLSGGMQQRVAIAQSLIMQPKVLLMDESFSALDPNTRKGMQQLIRSIWKESGTTVVFVTHNLSEAVNIGNRILQIVKEPDGSKSRISLDLRISDALRQNDEQLQSLMHRLEVGDLTAAPASPEFAH